MAYHAYPRLLLSLEVKVLYYNSWAVLRFLRWLILVILLKLFRTLSNLSIRIMSTGLYIFVQESSGDKEVLCKVQPLM